MFPENSLSDKGPITDLFVFFIFKEMHICMHFEDKFIHPKKIGIQPKMRWSEVFCFWEGSGSVLWRGEALLSIGVL